MEEEKKLDPTADQTTIDQEPQKEQAVVSQEKKEEQKPNIKPKLFANLNEDVKISVVGYYNKETGELEFALPDNSKSDDDEDSNEFIKQKNTFIFSRVPYNRLNIYRSRAGKYNPNDKSTVIDFLKFRDFLWTFHLKDWDLEDENGNKVELTHDIDGTLSSESEQKLWCVPSVILDMVIQMYENKLNLL